jgi:glutathione synthase/RimK-type ligase-like ATP-grasp enzyme
MKSVRIIAAMQTGGVFIRDRLLPKTVRQACSRMGIDVDAYSDSWLLRLAKDGRSGWVYGYKFGINQNVASFIAQDKVATYQLLYAGEVPSVAHYLVRSVAGESVLVDDLANASGLSGAVVAKPLFGTGARGVSRYDSLDKAIAMIRDHSEPAWAASPYISIEREFRAVMLDDTVLLAYEKQLIDTSDDMPIYNLSAGAVPKDISAGELESLALLCRRAMQTIGLRLGAVDVIEDTSGELIVMEINDGIMLEHYARFSDTNYVKAQSVYGSIIEEMMRS